MGPIAKGVPLRPSRVASTITVDGNEPSTVNDLDDRGYSTYILE